MPLEQMIMGMPKDEFIIGLIGSIILIVVPFLMIVTFIVVFLILTKKILNKRKQAVAQRNSVTQATKFVAKCKEYNIDDILDKNKTTDILLIAKNFNFNYKNYEDIKKAYELVEQARIDKEKAEQAAKNAEIERKKRVAEQELQNQKRKAKEKFENELKLTTITGKQKYLYGLNEKLHEYYKKKDKAEKSKQNTSHLYGKYKTDNYGWVGGAADAIAGPAAGVVAALESHERTVQHNKEVDAYNIALMNSGVVDKVRGSYDRQINTYHSNIDKIFKQQRQIENFLIQDLDIATIAKEISVTITPKLNKIGFLDLNLEINAPNEFKLLDRKAYLDGSLKITVLSPEGRKIATAYYNTPGFGTDDVSKIGFTAIKTAKTTALPIDNFTKFNSNTNYKFVTEPVSLWLVAK